MLGRCQAAKLVIRKSKNINNFKRYGWLIPSAMVVKTKKISEDQFISAYKEQLESMNPNKVYDDLNTLVSGLEPILMTDGSKKKFCHRHLVAEWLENELGIIIEEYKVGKVTRSKGYMKKNINPTLF